MPFRIPPHHDPHEVAIGFCTMVASPRGSATVVGDRLVAHDIPGSLVLLERMIEGLDHPGASAAPPAADSAPAQAPEPAGERAGEPAAEEPAAEGSTSEEPEAE